MNIIDFYKNLDALNLIIFWGIIIVIILLIIFIILTISKNKKTKKEKIESEESKIESEEPEYIPIKQEDMFFDKNELEYLKKEELSTPKEEIKKEEFNATEYIPNLAINSKEKLLLSKEELKNNVKQENLKAENIERKPYQKNILREMSLNQTSPIGIIRNNNQEEIKNKEQELYNSLNSTVNEKKESKENNSTYLKEVSNKLSDAISKDSIKRTEYEIKQEEDAIISYEELMQKKDSIQIVDEEEAVISIDELMLKEKEKEKIYKLTDEVENSNFINELKNFRDDL